MESLCYNGVKFADRPDLDNIARVDMGAIPMIRQFQRNGLRIDRQYFIDYQKWLIGECDDLSEIVSAYTGVRINIGSPEQVADLIFNHLGIKQTGRVQMTKGSDKKAPRPKVDDDVLEKLKNKHPVITLIQDFRERKKLAGTYCGGILKFAEGDRLHPTFKDTTVETGRLSAKDPNVLAIPTRTKLGRKIREGFIADPGWEMATIDLSQIEMRVGAHDSDDPNMKQVFHDGTDMYWATANLMFKYSPEQFKKILRLFDITEKNKKEAIQEMVAARKLKQDDLNWYYELKGRDRFAAKTTTLLMIYDGQAKTLLNEFLVAGALDWTESRCERVIKDWYAAYYKVKTRRFEHHRRAKRYGFVWDWFGRIRRIPQVRSVHPYIVSEGLRGAGNLPGQGTAQGIIKLAMARLEDERVGNRHWRTGVMPLLQVHDELLFQCRKGLTDDWMEFCKRTIQGMVPGFRVPIKSGWAKGERWADLEK